MSLDLNRTAGLSMKENSPTKRFSTEGWAATSARYEDKFYQDSSGEFIIHLNYGKYADFKGQKWG